MWAGRGKVHTPTKYSGYIQASKAEPVGSNQHRGKNCFDKFWDSLRCKSVFQEHIMIRQPTPQSISAISAVPWTTTRWPNMLYSRRFLTTIKNRPSISFLIKLGVTCRQVQFNRTDLPWHTINHEISYRNKCCVYQSRGFLHLIKLQWNSLTRPQRYSQSSNSCLLSHCAARHHGPLPALASLQHGSSTTSVPQAPHDATYKQTLWSLLRDHDRFKLPCYWGRIDWISNRIHWPLPSGW